MRIVPLILGIILITAADPARAQPDAAESAGAPIDSPNRTKIVVKQLIGGSLLGAGVGVIGAAIGGVSANCDNGDLFCGLAEVVIGGGVGVMMGSTLGVYGIGARNEQNGSFWLSLAGSALGLGGGIFLTSQADILFPSLFIAPAALSTAFYWFSNPSETRSSSNQIQFRMGLLQNGGRGISASWQF